MMSRRDMPEGCKCTPSEKFTDEQKQLVREEHGRDACDNEFLINPECPIHGALNFRRLPPGYSKPKPQIVCLCGSTRFMEAFHAAGWELTLNNYIVLSVGVCKHVGENEGHGAEALGPDIVKRLDELHFRKIDLADWV